MATVLQPGEGEQAGGATTVSIKAGGQHTGGTFYLGEVVAQPGFPSPPRHVHERLHDMFYVLDGTVRLQIDEETVELAAGGFACIPPGVVHTFSNPTDASVRFLNFNTPSGWENYMRDLDKALAGGTPTQAEIGEIASRYDFKSPDRTAVLTIKGSGGPREVVLLIRRNTVCRSARHGQPPRGALGPERPRGRTSPALVGIIGWRRPWTVSMISSGSMPRR